MSELLAYIGMNPYEAGFQDINGIPPNIGMYYMLAYNGRNPYDGVPTKIGIGRLGHIGLGFLKFSLILYISDRKIREKVVYFYNT